jgi:hypothetical protein
VVTAASDDPRIICTAGAQAYFASAGFPVRSPNGCTPLSSKIGRMGDVAAGAKTVRRPIDSRHHVGAKRDNATYDQEAAGS